jgi:hypothetical protein
MLDRSNQEGLDQYQEWIALEYKKPIPQLWRERVERLPDEVTEFDPQEILAQCYADYHADAIERVHEVAATPMTSRLYFWRGGVFGVAWRWLAGIIRPDTA